MGSIYLSTCVAAQRSGGNLIGDSEASKSSSRLILAKVSDGLYPMGKLLNAFQIRINEDGDLSDGTLSVLLVDRRIDRARRPRGGGRSLRAEEYLDALEEVVKDRKWVSIVDCLLSAELDMPATKLVHGPFFKCSANRKV